MPTVKAGVASGDYSILGHEGQVAVERKTLRDLAATLTGGRRRFIAEMERLAAYNAAWIVIEGQLSDMMARIELVSQVKPRTLCSRRCIGSCVIRTCIGGPSPAVGSPRRSHSNCCGRGTRCELRSPLPNCSGH